MSQNSSFAIVGAGAVAQALGHLLHERGHRVVGLADRTRARAEEAASFIGPDVQVVDIADLPALSPRILIAVADRGLTPVAERLADGLAEQDDAMVLHTSGASGLDAVAPLGDTGVPCGVLHPLQTITSPSQGVRNLIGVSFGVSGDPPALEWATRLATRLEGQPLDIDPNRLSAYHAGAVMASNAVVGVIDAALVLLAHAGVDRRKALYALGPLAFSSLENALTLGPREALTGPIVRGDTTTVAGHMEAMRAMTDLAPTVQALYKTVARHLLTLATERGLSVANRRAIEAALNDASAASV